MKPFIKVTPCILLVATGTFSCNQVQEEKVQPNIVIILVDDLGWKDTGYMGSEYYETPHIDRLAKNGMTFTQAYTNAANWYQERLAGNEKIITPTVPVGRDHIYHLYIVRLLDRDKAMNELGAHEIGCGLHYPIPLHVQTAYRDLGYSLGDFPVTEEVADSILSLPMFPNITEDMVDYVCRELLAIV